MPVLWCLECPDQKPESNFTTHNQRSGILSNIAPVVAALKPCLGWDDALLFPKAFAADIFISSSRRGRLLAFKVTCPRYP